MEQKSILMGMNLRLTSLLVFLKSKQIACWGSQLIPNMGCRPFSGLEDPPAFPP